MGTMQVDSDVQLVERLRAGDEAAFTELVRRYHVLLVRLAATFVARRDLAEDAVQDTWLAVLSGIDGFAGRAEFRTWLFTVCANKSRSLAVRERRTVPVDDVGADIDLRFARDGSWETPPRPWAGSMDDDVDDSALVAAVRMAIDALPESLRRVVTLRDVENMSAGEVCTVLSISDANQRVLLHRGRARVRAALERRVTR